MIGNECADAIAKAAVALGNKCERGVPPRENPFANCVWLAAPGPDPDTFRDLHDMGPAHRTQALSKQRLGRSNTQSVYWQGAQATAAAAAPGSCALPFRSSRITHAHLRFVLRLTYGVLYNQKHAHRWKKAATPACPICGAPDSSAHIVSGPCNDPRARTHANMITLRHHTLLRTVLEAIRDGSRGNELRAGEMQAALRREAAAAAAVAAEHADPHAEEDPDFDPEKLADLLSPQAFLAQLLGPARAPKRPLEEAEPARCGRSRPDAVMQHPRTGALTLIELKCCGTWEEPREEQVRKAQEQHAALVQELKDAGRQVQLVVILVAVNGITLETHTRQPLVDLGIPAAATPKVLESLSVKAIHASERIYRAMMALRQQHAPG